METIFALAGTVDFAWPLVFLLLPLPWLLARWSRRRTPRSAGGAIALPFGEVLPVSPRAPTRAAGSPFSVSGLLLFLLLLLAAARPQWIELADQGPVSGRDVLLLLDVSASMQIRDLAAGGGKLSRLAAASRFGRGFLDRRPGDRAGLIVFASRPYLYVPLTYDLTAVGAALDGAALGLAGEQTALGDALGLAVKILAGESGAAVAPAGAVAVLISDGANTAGALSPQQAAWLASQRRVRVYALGVGASPDETALRAMAEQSGGYYAKASDTAGVKDFFDRLDALEPVQRTATPVVAARELYFLPLILALLLGAIPVPARVAQAWKNRHAMSRRGELA